MVEGLAAFESSADEDAQVVLDALLADVLVEAARAQGALGDDVVIFTLPGGH